MHQFADAAGYTYLATGQYGFLDGHMDNLPPVSQWGFLDMPTVWDSDSNPGTTGFAAADFNTILLTAGNFRQYRQPDESIDERTPSGPTFIDATSTIFGWTQENAPGSTSIIYENWPDMAGYLSAGFPPSASEFDAYNAYLLGDFHQWWIDYHDMMLAAMPGVPIKMIPVGPVIAKALQTDTLSLRDIPVGELYEDDAPHGTANLYFLAAIATYIGFFNERPPSSFTVPSSIHANIRTNFAAVVEFFWDDLHGNYTLEDGSSRVFFLSTMCLTNVDSVTAVTVGDTVSFDFSCGGGVGEHTITVTGDVPNGVAVDTVSGDTATASFSGTTTAVGTFVATLTCADLDGTVAAGDVTINVEASATASATTGTAGTTTGTTTGTTGGPSGDPRVDAVRAYIFGHSLINWQLSVVENTQENTVPHWLFHLADHSGLSFRCDGEFGFLRNYAELPPSPQWGFDAFDGLWDGDANPGAAGFAAADYNTIILTAGNFIQYQAPDVGYYDDPDTTPVDATETVFQWVTENEPGIQLYIYENWPDMGGYVTDGTPTTEQWAAYNEYTLGGFHAWWLSYQDLLMARLPAENIKLLPVGPMLAKVLTTDTLPLRNIPLDALYEDDAPHGFPTIYFLASLATYMGIYNQPPGADFDVATVRVHALVADNYNAVVDFMWTDLLENYKFSDGSSRVYDGTVSATTGGEATTGGAGTTGGEATTGGAGTGTNPGDANSTGTSSTTDDNVGLGSSCTPVLGLLVAAVVAAVA